MVADSNALAVSLVEAAVRAAVLAGAPRRTVADHFSVEPWSNLDFLNRPNWKLS